MLENAAESPASSARYVSPPFCSNPLSTLLGDMRLLEPTESTASINIGIDGPSVEADVVRVEQGGGAVIARVETSGNWIGLRVSELRTTRFEGSDIESFQIRFRENPDRVRNQLNEEGFDLPEIDALTTVELEDGKALVYGVERVEGGSSLTCARI